MTVTSQVMAKRVTFPTLIMEDGEAALMEVREELPGTSSSEEERGERQVVAPYSPPSSIPSTSSGLPVTTQ